MYEEHEKEYCQSMGESEKTLNDKIRCNIILYYVTALNHNVNLYFGTNEIHIV